MKRGRTIRWRLAVLFFAACPVLAQHAGQTGSTGRLEVTATVVGSVDVVPALNGDLKVVVANVPDGAFLAQEALVLSKKYRGEKPGVREGSPDQIKKGTQLPGLVPFPISTDETCLLQ